MRIRTLKVLTMILALAVVCQPLQAFACDMEQNHFGQGDHSGNQDHSTMQMDHSTMQMDHSTMQMDHSTIQMDHSTMQMDHGADADCCDPENADTRDDCARMMSCGTCLAGTSIVSSLSQSALASVQTSALDIGSGKLLPSHSSPPYHPPNS